MKIRFFQPPKLLSAHIARIWIVVSPPPST